MQTYAALAGHSPGEMQGLTTSTIMEEYTKQENWGQIKEAQEKLLKKIDEAMTKSIDDYMKEQQEGGGGTGGVGQTKKKRS